MKFSVKKTIAAIATSAVLTMSAITSAIAFTFDQTELEQSNVAAIAQPRQDGSFQLLIIEQIPNQRQCWSESGSNPIMINPLLLNFDFTKDCKRATDSNGFSIRMGGTDLALQYSLSLQTINGDVLLVGSPSDRNAQQLIIGRTKGVVNGFMKIILEPGWRFTKRSYQGKILGHFYLTSNQAAPGSSGPVVDPSPSPTGFKDIATDIYATEIKEAVALGFVAGFSEDNTFRPQLALTREQLVSLVLESLKGIQGANIVIPSQTSTRPYSDVETSRWSAAKIQFARDKNIVSGYKDGTFRPTQPVTRAELMAVLRRASEFGLSARGLSPVLTPKQTPTNFSDIQGHWASATISQMSSYCKVASPLNEVGTRFDPDNSTKRNYAAAATLRMLKCVKGQ
ncbi:S-layer protein [Oscillatoriales cyanobacterium USR001]|nr:S-layer protein [Oscillatoriales cyanobacterium USR001]